MAGGFRGTARFQVERCLGTGTFGAVYAVWDHLRGTRVALKVPHEALAMGLLMFKREFRALAAVSHPNLVTLLELVAEDDTWFFTMELVEGVDCLSYLRQTRDWETLRRVFRQLALGLNALHRVGLIHRDLKPSNVLVTPQERVVLLDFGMVLERQGCRYTPGLPLGLGTHAYGAPEQREGGPGTESGDWYAMGVMLYQALAGRLPAPEGGWATDPPRGGLAVAPPSLFNPGLPADLEFLCLDLLSLDPAHRPGDGDVFTRLGIEEPMADLPDLESPIGRTGELQILLRGLDKVRDGTSLLVDVQGAPGMGKSMLVRHFMEDLHEVDPEALILHGRCFSEEDVPYKALDGLMDGLSRHLRQMSPAVLADLLPPWTPILGRLFPVLQHVPAIEKWPAQAPMPDHHETRRRAFACLKDILAKLARTRTLVLVLEDLHWGDPDSAWVLTELLQPPVPPLMLIRTWDPEQTPAPSDLEETPGLLRWELRLEPLPELTARRVARELLGPSQDPGGELSTWIARESHGHPFLIQELCRAVLLQPQLGWDPEGNLAAVARRRMETLEPSARCLMDLVVLAGHPTAWRVLRDASGLDDAAELLLPQLRNGQYVRVRIGLGGTRMIEPYHELLRRHSLEAMPPEAIRYGHRRLAESLERLDPGQHQLLALHYAGAGVQAKVAHYARLAGEDAARVMAFEQAARSFRQSLSARPAEDPDRTHLLVRLADTLTSAGRSREAAQAYLEAMEGCTGEAARILRRRAAEECFRSGRAEEALATLAPILQAQRIHVPKTSLGALGRALWSRACLRFRGFSFTVRHEQEIPYRDLERLDTLWAVAMGLGSMDLLRGTDFQARQLYLALAVGEPIRIVRGLAQEVTMQAIHGHRDLGRIEHILHKAEMLAREQPHPHPMARVRLAAGLAAFFQGRWKESAFCLDEAETLIRESCVGLDFELHVGAFFGLMAWTVMGDIPTLARRLGALQQEARERGDLLALTSYRVGAGCQLHLARDNPGACLQELDEATEAWGRTSVDAVYFHAFVGRTNALLYTGRPRDAWKHLRSAWSGLGWALFTRAQISRITCLELRARVRLALAAEQRAASPRRALTLWLAMRDIHSLRKERVTYGDALAGKLEAIVHRLGGRALQAVAVLEAAMAAFKACDMLMHAAVCGHALARWQGDGDAREAAELWMKAQGVLQPALYTRMHLPSV